MNKLGKIGLSALCGSLAAVAANAGALDVSGGATGAGGDKVFMENELVVTTDYELSANKSAVSVGPVTINTGISVTIPSGHTWVVL